MGEPGIYILKDMYLSMQKNQPVEMQRIRKLYLKEIENDIEFKWSNRERLLMDLKLFKAWYPEEWKGMSEDDLFRHFMDYFRRNRFQS